MNYLEQYEFWMNNDYFDGETKEELNNIKDNPKEIEERFYKELEFGTGGLRGIIGAGTNRINKYIVRKASQGFANYINQEKQADTNKSIVIAYDSRYKSPEFALESALVFSANGIKAYLFDELRPTPELSFAVRELKCDAGIVITASHNPKEYNGYKVYGEDGGQLPLEASEKVLEQINSIKDITTVKTIDEEVAKANGMLEIIGEEVDRSYIDKLKTLSINKEIIKKIGKDYKIVYTPIHGSGNKPVRRILSEVGFENVLVVKEQEKPDCEFSTVKYPNPEDKAAFNIGIELAKKENVDLIIGTDPDCDRIGIVVKDNNGEYMTFTGNQTGCLLLDYILGQKLKRNELPDNGFVVKTIVTTELSKKIAAHYNTELIEVLTGFKFIGEKIKLLDEQGDKKYLFGFEESYGYLAGTFARDKDAVVTAMLIGEMAAYYNSKNMTLYDALIAMYEKYGYSFEDLNAFTLKGKEGIEKIQTTMNNLRNNNISNFGSTIIKGFRDYKLQKRVELDSKKEEKINLPSSNVLYYETEKGYWFCVRPSGTEPKIKIYYGVSDSNREKAIKELENLKKDVLSVIEPMLK